MNDPKIWALIIAIISLIWNLLNTIYTRHTNTQNRRLSIMLEEFRSTVRQPIESVLISYQDLENKAETLSQSVVTKSTPDELIALNKDIVSMNQQLVSRLDDADRSQFAKN